jgi:hypothetical protein
VLQIGRIRDPNETKRAIEQQLELCVLPGGSDKVESAMRSSGIKDTTVAPIISYITAKGKALRGTGKSLKNADTSRNGAAEVTTQDFLDSTNIDANHIDVLVRYFVLSSLRALISLQDPTATAGDHSTQELASVPLREDTRKLSEPEIQAKLSEELGVLLEQRGMNPLLGMPGMIQSVSVGGGIHILQALTYIMIPQLKSSTRFSSVSSNTSGLRPSGTSRIAPSPWICSRLDLLPLIGMG